MQGVVRTPVELLADMGLDISLYHLAVLTAITTLEFPSSLEFLSSFVHRLVLFISCDLPPSICFVSIFICLDLIPPS